MKNQKRLAKEKMDNETPSEFFYIQPLPNDMFKWHFTMRGMPGTVYEGGLYHGYFEIPHDYPLSPPNIYFLNQSGRYQTNTKICLTITSYHKEEWTPAWTLRTMMEALCAYFTVNDSGIGSMTCSDNERKNYAKSSRAYKCPQCGEVTNAEKLILEKHKK